MARGEFVWHDLMTRDVEAAKAFYGALLGWTFRDTDGMGGAYTMIDTDRGETGGIMELPDGFPGPSHWLPYVAVEDCMEAVDLVAAEGGEVIMGATPIPGVGYFAVIKDPMGAVLNLMQVDDPDSAAQPSPAPGEFCWYTLHTRNLDAAVAFYGKLCGWTAKEVDLGGGWKQPVFHLGERQMAGLSAGDQSYWTMAVVARDDVPAAHAKALSLGGSEVMAPAAVGAMGQMCVVSDPTGAVISLFRANAG